MMKRESNILKRRMHGFFICKIVMQRFFGNFVKKYQKLRSVGSRDSEYAEALLKNVSHSVDPFTERNNKLDRLKRKKEAEVFLKACDSFFYLMNKESLKKLSNYLDDEVDYDENDRAYIGQYLSMFLHVIVFY